MASKEGAAGAGAAAAGAGSAKDKPAGPPAAALPVPEAIDEDDEFEDFKDESESAVVARGCARVCVLPCR